MNIPTERLGRSDTNGDSADGVSVVRRLRRCVEHVSLGFGRWDDPHAHGPGLYFVVARESVAAFAEPMGRNRWPVEVCPSVFEPREALSEAAQTVAVACDGAVIVHTDGTIEEGMVRLAQLSTADRERRDDLSYAEWMGTRHMSALETSTREAVLAVITLSEEDGRMTIFTDGAFEDHSRDTLTERKGTR